MLRFTIFRVDLGIPFLKLSFIVFQMSSLFVLLIATAALIPKGLMASIAETSVNRLHEPEADCVFSVHDKGPNGEEVSGNSLFNASRTFKSTPKVKFVSLLTLRFGEKNLEHLEFLF